MAKSALLAFAAEEEITARTAFEISKEALPTQVNPSDSTPNQVRLLAQHIKIQIERSKGDRRYLVYDFVQDADSAVESLGGFPVDLACGGHDGELLFLRGVEQDDLGAADVGLDGAHGALDDLEHAHRGGEVEDDVRLVDELGDVGSAEERVHDQPELRVRPGN